jgi:peptide/nickel transport system substrate-binding protein
MNDSSTSYWARALGTPIGRRRLIRGSAVAGAGIAGAALIGCGSSSTATATPAASKATTAAAAATGSATAAAAAGPKSGGTFKYFLALDPTTLDPYANASYTAKSFAGFVYSRLYRVDAQPGKNPYDQPPTPDLAASAESPDGATWTVKLKQGTKFQNLAPVNGREFTSADVKFSWDRLNDPKSPNVTQVPKGATLAVVDDYTLKFTLPTPSPTFLEFLADSNTLWIQPKEVGSGLDPAKTPIGTGPWMMTNYTVSSKINFKKHPDYFVKGMPYMDGVDLAIIPEYANEKAQFESGNLHAFPPQLSDVLDMKGRLPKLQWNGYTSAVLYMIYFGPQDQDPSAPWRDERYRQGVSMALDRAGLLDLQYNVTELKKAGLDVSDAWNNLLPDGFGTRFWLDPKSSDQGPSAKYFNYDVAEAKKLFAAVGNTDQPFTYQYTGNGYGSVWVSYAEAAGNMLAAAGLKPQTETQDYSSKYITQTFRGNFHGMTYGIETPFPEAGSYFDRMFGDDPANHGKIHDADIDVQNAKQKVAIDPAARTQAIYEIQRINDTHMYYVPTPGGGGTSFTGYQSNVHGTRVTRGYAGATEQLPFYWLDT